MIVGYTVTLSKVGNSYRVVIPKPACIGLQWNRGDRLNLSIEEGKITITKAPLIEERKRQPAVAPSQKTSTPSKTPTTTGKIPSRATKREDVVPKYVPKESSKAHAQRKK